MTFAEWCCRWDEVWVTVDDRCPAPGLNVWVEVRSGRLRISAGFYDGGNGALAVKLTKLAASLESMHQDCCGG